MGSGKKGIDMFLTKAEHATVSSCVRSCAALALKRLLMILLLALGLPVTTTYAAADPAAI